MSERERFVQLVQDIGERYDWQMGWAEAAFDAWQAALADRPERPVAWRIRWAPDRTTDWIDFAKNPPTDIDREASESRGTFEYAYAAPVDHPESAQPLRQFGDVRYAAAVDLVRSKSVALLVPQEQHQIRHVNGLYPPNTSIRLQVLGCYATAEYTDIDVQLPRAPQEPAQPVAPETSSDVVCMEDDGCPRELAVLQRFWRAHHLTEREWVEAGDPYNKAKEQARWNREHPNDQDAAPPLPQATSEQT